MVVLDHDVIVTILDRCVALAGELPWREWPLGNVGAMAEPVEVVYAAVRPTNEPQLATAARAQIFDLREFPAFRCGSHYGLHVGLPHVE